ncbi:DNA replication and repair protein RecF [Peribacillus frigoritolerans]|nr:DNA replication and repair protein RecF [Peribacillus frigoritolerans]
MELKQIYLLNFRGYKEAKLDFNEGMNILIGRNDLSLLWI